MTDFPSGNDPSLKSIFVISPEIPELDLTRWSDRDIDGQRVDGDGNVRMEEALHAKRPRKQGSLGEILMLCQGQERAVKVPIRNENDDVSSQVRSKREDARNGSFSGSKCAIVASAEAALDAGAIGEGEEGDDKMIRMWDRVDMDGVVVCGRQVCKVNDGRGSRWCCRDIESGEDSGVGPRKTHWDAKGRKGGGEEGGKRGRDWNGGEVECGGVIVRKGAEKSSGRELQKADGKCLTVLHDGVFDGWDGKHVM